METSYNVDENIIYCSAGYHMMFMKISYDIDII